MLTALARSIAFYFFNVEIIFGTLTAFSIEIRIF